MFGNGRIGSSELISGFENLGTSSTYRTGKCSSELEESDSLLSSESVYSSPKTVEAFG